MAEVTEAAGLAVSLLLRPDAGLLRIIGLSLGVSLAAAAVAALVGLPFGAVLGVYPFPGRRGLVLLANALLGLPPVVVGLALYLLLSRAGPFGGLGLLFTPSAMIAAQALLALPIVTALGHRPAAAAWGRYGDEFLALGLTRLQAMPHLFRISRDECLTAALAGFGRSVSEVGAILIVGGNIAGYTRTVTTAITLETAQGHLAYAMTLGLVLIAISLAVSGAAFLLSGHGEATGAGLDHVGGKQRAARPYPAPLHGADQHRGQDRGARHRPGARHRRARRCGFGAGA